MESGCDLDQNTGAAVFLTRKLVQPESFERGAELGREYGDSSLGSIVKGAIRSTLEEGDGADGIP